MILHPTRRYIDRAPVKYLVPDPSLPDGDAHQIHVEDVMTATKGWGFPVLRTEGFRR